MIDDDGFLEELRKEFLIEANSLLEQWEESFLKLEETEDKASELANIFRVAHSIKGTSSAVGFQEIASFAHHAEDLLSIIKERTECVTPEIISLLLQCGDALKQKIAFLMGSESTDWEVEELSAEIKEQLAWLGHACGGHKAAPSSEGQTEAWKDPNIRTEEEEEEEWKKLLAQVNEKLDINITEEDLNLTDEEIIQKVEEQKKTKSVVQQAPAQVVQLAPKVTSTPKEAAPSSAVQGKNSVVKVDASKIDKIMNLIGELVINKSQLANRVEQHKDDQQLEVTFSLLEKTIRELQDETLGIRMISLKNLFLKCQRAVRDVSLKLGKNIEFIQSGEDVQIDRSMVELITDPLLHMLRNAADHGIESDEERATLGKGSGTIILKAEHVGSKITIQIIDNGKGIDASKIYAKARQKGLIEEHVAFENLSKNDIYQFILLPGFSTAEKITDVSGRGVGLDVVKSSIEKLNGKVDIDSNLGHGTKFRLTLPLTTSILEGIHVNSGKRPYIFPTEKVLEILAGDSVKFIHDPNGSTLFKYRDHVIPYATLDSVLNVNQDFRLTKMVLIVEMDGKHFGVGIDEFVAQVHVVLKPINEIVKTSTAISASCILSHGGIGLIIDTDEVCQIILKQSRSMKRPEMAA